MPDLLDKAVANSLMAMLQVVRLRGIKDIDASSAPGMLAERRSFFAILAFPSGRENEYFFHLYQHDSREAKATDQAIQQLAAGRHVVKIEFGILSLQEAYQSASSKVEVALWEIVSEIEPKSSVPQTSDTEEETSMPWLSLVVVGGVLLFFVLRK
jgi:hypothetical protein